MSSLQFFLISFQMFYYFSRAVSIENPSPDELRKEINKTQHETAQVLRELLGINIGIDKVSRDIEAAKVAFEIKHANFTAEEKKLLTKIQNLYSQYSELNHTIAITKKEIEILSDYNNRQKFAILLFSTDLEFYNVRNLTNVQNTCFDFAHNKTRNFRLPKLFKVSSMILPFTTTQDPLIVSLEAILTVAQQNLTDAKMQRELRIKLLTAKTLYLSQYRNFIKNFEEANKNSIILLKGEENSLIRIVRDMESKEKYYEKELQKLRVTVEGDTDVIKHLKDELKKYEKAKKCYEEFEKKF